MLAATAIGCAGSSHATRDVATSSTTSVRATTSVAAISTTSTTMGAKGPVTLAFAGDVHFEGPLRTALDNNPATVLSAIAPVLKSYDITMVNLETAITEPGTPAAKQFTFRAPPSALTALTDAGIKVATEANNHGEDYGPIGLADSLAARANSPGVHVIGIGKDADDAFAPYRATVHGDRVAIIAATQVIDASLATAWTATDNHPGLASAKDLPRLLAAVRSARRDERHRRGVPALGCGRHALPQRRPARHREPTHRRGRRHRGRQPLAPTRRRRFRPCEQWQ